MAIGYVNSAKSSAVSSVETFDIGTLGTGARAGLVFVVTYSNLGVPIDTGVTWNGTSMTQLYYGADTNTEPGAVRAYFLDNVSNGTITVSRTNNTVVTIAYAISISSAAAAAVAQVKTEGGGGTVNTDANTSENGTAASGEVAVDDGSPGTSSMRFAAAYTGNATPLGAGTNSTSLQSDDQTAFGSSMVRETTAGQGSRNVGFATGVTDDYAFVAVAVKQVAITYSSSFTANAVIRKTQPGSFTANAIVQANSGTKTFTADAEIEPFHIHQTGDFAADAIALRGSGTKTFVADAVILRGSGTKTFAADAVIAAGRPHFVCGFECGQVAAGYENEPWDKRHWAWDSTPATLETTIVRSGSRAGRFTSPSSTGVTQLEHDPPSTARRTYARLYIYFDSDPTTATDPSFLLAGGGDGAASAYNGVVYDSGTDQVRAFINNVYSTTNSFTPSQGVWYGLEYWSDAAAAKQLKWRWWSEATGWSSAETLDGGGNAFTTYQFWGIGMFGAGGTGVEGFTMVFDDICVGFDADADALWAAGPTDGSVLTYYPVSDGTHSFSTTGDFTKTGTDATSSDTDLYSYLDSTDMRNSTEYIEADTGATDGEYVEVAFGNETGAYGDPRGVSITGRVSTVSGTADIAWDTSSDGSVWSRDLDVALVNASDIHMMSVAATQPVGGWTKDTVNAAKARLVARGGRWYVYGLAMEVEWTSGATTVSSSFTANAVIKSTRPDSFSADSIQLKTRYFGSGPDPR